MSQIIQQTEIAQPGVTIGQYEFSGPFADVSSLDDRPGLLALLIQSGEEFELITLCECADVRARAKSAFENDQPQAGKLVAAVYYVRGESQPNRERLCREILAEFE